MSKLYAFVKRDILEQASYKFAFISSFFSIIFSTSTFFFLSRLISGPQIESLRIYGGSYFAFVIIGIAFSGTLQVFQGNLPGVIREAQVTGTLEAMLVTKTGIPTILLGSSLYNFMFSLANSIIHIILAVLVFGMQLGKINWPGLLITFVLTAVCFLSVGILSSCFILVYKKGNPFGWIFGSLSSLLGGVFFPIALLPDWLRWISYLLPIKYSLEGFRMSMLASATFLEIIPKILPLFVFIVLLLPISLIFFRLALRRAKKDGSLTHY